jgi:PIN domain nuclease of toxin-antitoxin system
MSRSVFDSSAILAVVNREPGADLVRRLIPDGLMSAVNAAEVYTKLSEYGPEAIAVALELLDIVEIVPFNADQARRTGDLRASTREAGLSLGDRACLALGMELDAEVLTTETVWAKLGLPCSIRSIRPASASVQ